MGAEFGTHVVQVDAVVVGLGGRGLVAEGAPWPRALAAALVGLLAAAVAGGGLLR